MFLFNFDVATKKNRRTWDNQNFFSSVFRCLGAIFFHRECSFIIQA